LIQGLFEHPLDEGIAIYCDQDKSESLVKSLAAWHTAYLRANQRLSLSHPNSAARKIVISYGSNLDFVPLQGADVVANSSSQAHCASGTRDPATHDLVPVPSRVGSFCKTNNL
jgi:hypothetical protein